MLKLLRLLLLWLVCDFCQTSTNGHVVFKWLYLPLRSRQPAVIYQTTDWWWALAWPWIKLLCVICGGENGINGCYLAVQPHSSAVGISNISNKISKMVGNMVSHQLNSWWIEGLGIATELWQISCNHLVFFPSDISNN